MFLDTRPTVLHVAINFPTAYMPGATSTGVGDGLTPDMDQQTKYKLNRAKRFTDQVIKDLEAIPGRATIVSIGSDGLSCNTKLLKPFFQNIGAFDLVIRHHFIRYKDGKGPSLDPTLLLQCGRSKCWWKRYSSENLLGHFDGCNTEELPKDIHELIVWWNDLQYRKDLRREFALVPGRNAY